MTTLATEVLTVDESSGVLHKRWRVEGYKELIGFEADNLDQAGAFAEVEDERDERVKSLCQRCFPVKTDG